MHRGASPDVGTDLLRGQRSKQHLRCLTEADRRFFFAAVGRKQRHSRVHQVLPAAKAGQHRERVLVIEGLFQDDAIELKDNPTARGKQGTSGDARTAMRKRLSSLSLDGTQSYLQLVGAASPRQRFPRKTKT